MTKVFVSGCYDILHGGHIQFFKDARALGDHLTVCFASDEVYRAWKGREPALPEDSRRAILEELRCVDLVVMSRMNPSVEVKPWLDWVECFEILRPDWLVTTSDDMAHFEEKQIVAASMGARWHMTAKTTPRSPVSTSQIRERAGL